LEAREAIERRLDFCGLKEEEQWTDGGARPCPRGQDKEERGRGKKKISKEKIRMKDKKKEKKNRRVLQHSPF